MRLLILFLLLCLSGCVGMPVKFQQDQPQVSGLTKTKRVIPEPAGGKIVVGVYSFTDKTGQRKDGGAIAKLSSAVTQGGETLLLKSLQDVGDGKWFRVVERVNLDNLLKERQLIRSAREEVKDVTPLRTVLYAGMLIEGAIVSYDTNVKTGGFGVRYLGIGPNTQYQEDMVTVSIRVVSVSTGEVLLTVNSEKKILSVAESVAVFKFYDSGTKNFENEFGVTSNEPGVYALKSAIDNAVEEMIYQGSNKGIWKFKKEE
jgi:curli production assembly/transport component CsgG